MKSQANTKLFLRKQTISELSFKQLSKINGGSNTIIKVEDEATHNDGNIPTSENTVSTFLCKN